MKILIIGTSEPIINSTKDHTIRTGLSGFITSPPQPVVAETLEFLRNQIPKKLKNNPIIQTIIILRCP